MVGSDICSEAIIPWLLKGRKVCCRDSLTFEIPLLHEPILFACDDSQSLSFKMSQLTWYNIAICLVVSGGDAYGFAFAM